MEINGSQTVPAAGATGASPELRQGLQIKMLQKQLEMQESQALQLIQSTTGKGKLIDIRA